MAMPRSQPAETSAFGDHIAELAATYYDNDESKAFRHAAFQLAAQDPNIADTQVIEATGIDKPGDLEIDGWYVDDNDESILLFQSQGGKRRANEGKVAKFWLSPEELLEPGRIAATPNQSVHELSRELEGLVRNEYGIRLVFASRGGFERAAQKFAQPKSKSERAFTLSDGTKVTCSCTLELLTESDLARRFDEYRSGFLSSGSTDITLAIDPSNIYSVGEPKSSLRATVKASEIVRIFRTKGIGYRLFSLNPRGPLANAKPNKNIERTLDSEPGRRQFHLLNNGLCATCHDFDISNTSITVKNFQIVNGCQTTVSLNKRTEDELEQTLVDLKLTIADWELAERIAIASNTQTALRARDYASFEEEQLRLQREFAIEARPPWYYEVKQGYWRFVLTDSEKARFKTGRRKRHIEVQPLAQASLAFLGLPDEALDRVRFVFEGIKNSEEREQYERAFPQGIKARQLLLPWQILDYLEKPAEKDERPKYSTFHALWLIAEFLRTHSGLQPALPFSTQKTADLLKALDNWLPLLTPIAYAACSQAYQRAQYITGDSVDLRDFFRASGELEGGINPKVLVKEAFNNELKMAERSGRNPKDQLPP